METKTAIMPVMPEFTAEDFSTSAPYEWLYSFNDKFTQAQMREKLKKQAADKGIKGFIGLWEAYRETVSAQKGYIIDNATMFDGQEIELLSGKYICTEQGVTMVDKHGYEVVVCPHPILPIQRLVNVDSGEERLKIAYKKGRQWRSIIVEKTVIASSNSILQLAANGIVVNSENAKLLSSYLLELEQWNYDEIPERKSISHLGWTGSHGFSPYVEDLVFDGEASYRNIFNSVKSNGNYDKWLNAMRDLRKYGTAGKLILAASFASVIIEPCGLLPFFLHAWGTTECGKSVLLMIAASVWASPRFGDYITTFNSTSVGQELQASFLNSLPMCIDELQIQSSQGIKDFDRIIYQLTEGIGRTRGAKVGGLQRLNTWKNCIITNGEQPISNANSGGGAINRVLEFECTEKVYSDLVGLCAVIQNNYGFAGREFVEWLQEDNHLEEVNQLQKEYYRELLKSDSTDKQAASVSAILAADKIATDLIFKDGNNISIGEIALIMTAKEDVDINVRALEYVFEMVARNSNKFITNEMQAVLGELWGKIDGGDIYIIKSVFDREMTSAGFSPSAFLAWAKRKGYCSTEAGKRTKKSRIAGNLVNCVCLKRDATTAESKKKEDYLKQLVETGDFEVII